MWLLNMNFVDDSVGGGPITISKILDMSRTEMFLPRLLGPLNVTGLFLGIWPFSEGLEIKEVLHRKFLLEWVRAPGTLCACEVGDQAPILSVTVRIMWEDLVHLIPQSTSESVT